MDTKQEMQDIDINKTISQNLKIARQVKGFTVKDMGKMLGITYQQFQKYETGKNAISIFKLLKIANYLGLPVDFFFKTFDLNNPNNLLAPKPENLQNSEFFL